MEAYKKDLKIRITISFDGFSFQYYTFIKKSKKKIYNYKQIINSF